MRALRLFTPLLIVVALPGCMHQADAVAVAAAPDTAASAVVGTPPKGASARDPAPPRVRSAPVPVRADTNAPDRSSRDRRAPDPQWFAGLPPTVRTATPAAAEAPYTLEAGDRLRVVVAGRQIPTHSYQVDAAGTVTLPRIGGVPARGLTPAQLSQVIATRLQQGHMREPEVAVEMEAYRPFFVVGEVMQPGQFPYVPDMTVETAVAIAGGFAPRADDTVIHLGRVIDGTLVRSKVSPDTRIRAGDTVTVDARRF